MKKILVYKSTLLPYSETFIKEQVLALSRWTPVLAGYKRVPGLALNGLDVRLLYGERPGRLGQTFWRFNRMFDRVPGSIVSTLKEEGFSLLHAHFGPEAIYASLIAKKLDIPLLVTLHGIDINLNKEWWKSGRGGFLNRRYPERLLRLAKEGVKFVAVSEAIRQRAILTGVPPESIVVRYIGVDVGRFSPSTIPLCERRRRVLFVGRLVEKKGCHVLIKAIARIIRDVPDVDLVIIGDGPLRTELETLAHTLNVPAIFTGALPSTAVKQHMDEARVLCLPSVVARNGDAEGFGLVILEAQACGVPVITSALGGRTEGIAEGVTGFGFPEGDIDTLASRLRTVLLDGKLAADMSAAARQFVISRFDIRACTRNLEDLYDQVAGQYRAYAEVSS